MSVADKQLFLSRVSQGFSSEITVDLRDKLLGILSQEITNYTIDFTGAFSNDRTSEILNEF